MSAYPHDGEPADLADEDEAPPLYLEPEEHDHIVYDDPRSDADRDKGIWPDDELAHQGEPGDVEDTDTFALIAPDGTLTFEQGVPDVAWSRVDERGDAEGFTVQHPGRREERPGVRAYVGATSALDSEKYPYNAVGSRVTMQVAAEAGGRMMVDLYGHVALCGYVLLDDGDVTPAGLTPEQQEVITAAHVAALGSTRCAGRRDPQEGMW